MQTPASQISTPLHVSPSSQLASMAHSIELSGPLPGWAGAAGLGAEDSPLAQPALTKKGISSREKPSRGECSVGKATSRTDQDALSRRENHVVNRTLSVGARG